MKFLNTYISLQEIPGEISIIFNITNCPHRCPGCHSKELWTDQGTYLSESIYVSLLEKYSKYISAVVFFGGEWDSDLLNYLIIAKNYSLKTCLYTGANDICKDLKTNLNYLKTGPYISSLGGLDSINTNQKFLDLDKKVELNYLFQRNSKTQSHTSTTQGESYVKINEGTN